MPTYPAATRSAARGRKYSLLVVFTSLSQTSLVAQNRHLFIIGPTRCQLQVRGPLDATALPSTSRRTTNCRKRSAARSRTRRHAAAGVEDVAFWIVSFSATHIGLSAARDGIISWLGMFAAQLGLVGTGIELPPLWPGDASGNKVWEDEAQAGRQLFRIFYSLIAAATLQAAFVAYVVALPDSPSLIEPLSQPARGALLAIGCVAQGIAIASLANPSPLSLVPGFKTDPKAFGGLIRDDSLKLRAFGLTRMTRHPLILPVVPWAVANGFLAGGRLVDIVLFGGIAVYALAGCWAQDLRARESAAVGTVFARGDLTQFYETTSFVPFQALFDGRQSWSACFAELSWLSLIIGIALGTALEFATASALS